jgi:aminoglycoside phosphotransferase family enzyme/predicted kinase
VTATATPLPVTRAPTDAGADLHETHCAIVLLLGDRAYKVKKPVDLGFLDFREISERERTCRREVELNRRLAPDVYLGVGHFSGPGDGTGEPAVVMRRMPDDRRLSTMLRAREPVDEPVRQVARLLADFHAGAATGPDIACDGEEPALRRRWIANLRETDRFVGSPLDASAHAEVESLATRFLDGRAPLLAARAAAGLVRDGHGDLVADDIFCLPDGPRVLDCLEFDDRLRHVDVLDDVAFLAMDLERLGAPGPSQHLLDWYAEFAGHPRVPSLEHHYMAYRAFVRAKVACLQADQGVTAAAPRARHLTDLTRRHLRQGAIALVLVGGIPGAGKTTLATGLCDRLGWLMLRSDEVRREVAPQRADRYSPRTTRATYDELLRRARSALSLGASVVLDATWSDPALRATAQVVALETSSDLVELECFAPVEVAAARAGRRLAAGEDVSEADPDIVRSIADRTPAWPSAVRVSTDSGPEAALAAALKHLARYLPEHVPPRPKLPPD